MRIGTADAAKRGVFTTAPIRTGDIMAVVPLQLSLAVSTNNLLVSLQMIFGYIVKIIDQLLVCSNSLPTWLVTS